MKELMCHNHILMDMYPGQALNFQHMLSSAVRPWMLLLLVLMAVLGCYQSWGVLLATSAKIPAVFEESTKLGVHGTALAQRSAELQEQIALHKQIVAEAQQIALATPKQIAVQGQRIASLQKLIACRSKILQYWKKKNVVLAQQIKNLMQPGEAEILTELHQTTSNQLIEGHADRVIAQTQKIAAQQNLIAVQGQQIATLQNELAILQKLIDELTEQKQIDAQAQQIAELTVQITPRNENMIEQDPQMLALLMMAIATTTTLMKMTMKMMALASTMFRVNSILSSRIS